MKIQHVAEWLQIAFFVKIARKKTTTMKNIPVFTLQSGR
tara:strand:+ start:741 stop:857 length:117 start_codon:yes stop_codon:yes gene_type:complete